MNTALVYSELKKNLAEDGENKTAYIQLDD